VIRRGFDQLIETRSHVVDYGIRGVHLAHDLLDEWDALVLIDAVPDQGSPGTLHVFEADLQSSRAAAVLDVHSMDPAAVFAGLTALGGEPPYTVVVGCEVLNVEEGMGLSAPVEAAVADAVDTVLKVVSTVAVRAATGGA
jgi:hydrogenase maturation protease